MGSAFTRMRVLTELLRSDRVAAPEARLDLCAVHATQADFVWRSLQRLGVKEPDLPDVLQDVFVVVHRRLSSFDGSSELTTWLFGICLRVAAGYRRRVHRGKEQLTDRIPDPEHGSEEPNPEEAFSAKEERERLAEVLDGMDLEKRAVFVMFEIDGLSCPAIAHLMGVPVGTVYSRLSAAREAFQRLAARRRRRS